MRAWRLRDRDPRLAQPKFRISCAVIRQEGVLRRLRGGTLFPRRSMKPVDETDARRAVARVGPISDGVAGVEALRVAPSPCIQNMSALVRTAFWGRRGRRPQPPDRNFTILRHAIDSANSAEKALIPA